MAENAEKNKRLWIMLCHLSALLGLVGIPLGHVLGPLIVWAFKKNEIPEVDAQGKEALNFQISMTLYGAGAFLLCFIVIGFLLLPLVILADLVLVVVAAVKADKGESYRYPATIRLIK
ncbi:MAG: DUF4870 domain-containing protein [Candidatus Omnitrophota bacterium]